MAEEDSTQVNNAEVQEALSEEILADAKRRAQRALQKAERDGKRLEAREVKKAQDLREHVIRQAKDRVARDRTVFDSALRLEERRRRLAVQGEVIDEAFDRALAKLKSREGYDYREALVALTVEAVAAMRGEAFVLKLNAADREQFGQELPPEVARLIKEQQGRDVKLGLDERTVDVAGGVVVAADDGLSLYDNSLDARLTRMSGDLRFLVGDVLFKDEEDPEAQPQSPKPEAQGPAEEEGRA